MKITLLGQEFLNDNLGCDALSYAFVNEFELLCKKLMIDAEYTAVVFRADKLIQIPNTTKRINLIKIKYKSLKFWKNLRKNFKNADLIVDLTGGDSFADIYGIKRFLMASIIKRIAIDSKTPFMLGPQTYGPFQRVWVRKIASQIIKKSTYVFARDKFSKEYAEELSGRTVVLTTDVAFSLPYERKEIEDGNRVRICFNPSGLLWKGGYDNAKLQMATDYQAYCRQIVDYLTKQAGYSVYLLPHVISSSKDVGESDSFVCELLHDEFPNTIIARNIDSPMSAKGFISAMDLFIGSRMHGTIAALSTGVANIPVSYSRKFEGLYDSLDYPYVIHAKTQNTNEAIDTTIKYISDLPEIQRKSRECQSLIAAKVKDFRSELEKIIIEIKR